MGAKIHEILIPKIFFFNVIDNALLNKKLFALLGRKKIIFNFSIKFCTFAPLNKNS